MPRILLAVAVVALVGCSSQPSENQIEEAIRSQVVREAGDGLLTVENLQKVDGYEEPPNRYVADVKFDIVFLKSLDEYAAELSQQTGDNPLGGMAVGLGAMALKMSYGDFKAGDRVSKQQQITLVEAEQGWRVIDPGKE